MPATILDGKQLAQQLRTELTEEVVEFIQNNGVVPCLAAVLVGDNPASEVYVRNKQQARAKRSASKANCTGSAVMPPPMTCSS